MKINRSMSVRSAGSLMAIAFLTVVGACGSSPGTTTGTGGASASGGRTGSGGLTSSGGVTGSGGLTSSGGVTGSGGLTSSGGVTGTGGLTSSGGTTGTGGASSSSGGAAGGRGGGAAGGRGGGAAGGRGGGPSTGTGGAPSDGGAPDGGIGYMPCPTTAGTACAVLPLGDSITEGCCTAPEGGYRIELFTQAVMHGKNLTFVGTLTNGPTTVANRTFPSHHEGHGGYTIAGGGQGAIAGNVADKALSSTHPNIVLLMIGTNDINGNIDVANAPTRLGQLIDEIITDAPEALVVVSTIIPISAPGGDQQTKTFNAAIPGLVSARAGAGKHVIMVDNYAAFSKDQTYQTTLKADGLHPNTTGYVILGQSFYDAISGLLPPGP